MKRITDGWMLKNFEGLKGAKNKLFAKVKADLA
jgi:hypothetical protein